MAPANTPAAGSGQFAKDHLESLVLHHGADTAAPGAEAVGVVLRPAYQARPKLFHVPAGVLATALIALASTASAQTAGQWCTKVGFQPGTPDPNVCYDVELKAPATGSTGQPGTLQQARAHADRGDARTLQQSQAYADTADARTLAAAEQHTRAQVASLQREAFAGIAAAAALVPMDPAADGETTVNLGAATYGGQTAIGIALARQIGRTTFTAGAGTSGNGGRTLVRVGLGWRF